MKNTRPPRSRHLWMMALCCGLPILGFLLLGSSRSSSPSLATFLVLICPVVLGAVLVLNSEDEDRKNQSVRQTSHRPDKQPGSESTMPAQQGSIFDYRGRFMGRTGTSFRGRKRGNPS